MYVQKFEKFFGVSNMTYNVHLLLHIVDGVRDWGPLWTHSAFAFENENRLLLNHIDSPNEIAKQVVLKHLMFSEFYSISVIIN